MMRRKSNKHVPASWIIGVVSLALIVLAAIYFSKSYISDPYRAVPDLPLADYVENSVGYRGNVYRFTGTVENQIGWSPDTGRLVSFKIILEGRSFYVATLLPATMASVNIQKGQRFEVKVKVINKGLLEALEVRKS
jgi:hypothetical protein